MSLLDSIIEFFLSLFGAKPKTTPTQPTPTPTQPTTTPTQPTTTPTQPTTTPSPKPTVPADNTTEPAQIVTSKVLVIVYDPVVDSATGKKLSQHLNWSQADDLITKYIDDITESSKGLARYQIVQRADVDEFLPLEDGFLYTVDSFLSTYRHTNPAHSPGWLDYSSFLERFDILQRIARNELDEVWVFAFPFAGLFESVMAGKGAFWCNSQPLAGTGQISRRFVMMGFSLERGVGEMFESFTHRCESIMTKVFEQTAGDDNLYERFSRYDKKDPGKAECGTVHYAPNSERDYDWDNPRLVPSKCDDWYNFPNFTGVTRMVNNEEWGNGDIRLHHLWWLDHFPRVNGRTNGIVHNWWQYVIDPNKVVV